MGPFNNVYLFTSQIVLLCAMTSNISAVKFCSTFCNPALVVVYDQVNILVSCLMNSLLAYDLSWIKMPSYRVKSYSNHNPRFDQNSFFFPPRLSLNNFSVSSDRFFF